MKKIFSTVYWLILGIALLIAGTVVLSTFNTPLKVRLFAVLSGSMEPAVPLGSVVVVIPQEGYQKEDIITVRSERNVKETVTHRIIDIVEEGGDKKFKLKGDANEESDGELVSENRVIGKVIFNLPQFGYIVNFAQTQIGFVILVVIPATIIIYSEATNIKKEIVKFFKKDKRVTKKEIKEDEES